MYPLTLHRGGESRSTYKLSMKLIFRLCGTLSKNRVIDIENRSQLHVDSSRIRFNCASFAGICASQHLLSGDGSLCLVVLFNQESVQMSLPGWVVLRFNFFFTDRSCSSIIISLLTFHQEVYCGGWKLIWDLSVEYGICNLDASFSPWNSWLESRTKLSFGWIN